MKKMLSRHQAAFPRPISSYQVNNEVVFSYDQTGMLLRDYFAAKALQGMLSHGIAPETGEKWVADQAYRLADAMLASR